MLLKKFAIGILSFITGLMILTLVLSSNLDLSPGMIIEEVYDHANQESRDELFEMLKEPCRLLNEGKEVKTDDVDIQDIKNLCLNQEKGIMDDKEFLIGYINLAMPNLDKSDLEQAPQEIPLSSLITFYMNFLKTKTTIIVLLIVSVVLMCLLFLKDIISFVIHIGKLLIRTGLILVVPYLLIKIYYAINSPDTSFIFEAITKGAVPGPEKMVGTVLPITFNMIYSANIFVIGTLFVMGGIAVLFFAKKRKNLHNF